jgi:hypothetical protein
MRFLMCLIIAAVVVVSFDSKPIKPNYLTQVCGSFARENGRAVKLLDNNGISYALRPRNNSIGSKFWKVSQGARGCVYSNDMTASNSAQQSNRASLRLIYVDSVTIM